MIKECLSPLCTTERKNGQQGCVDPTITFEGAVLAKYERNGYDDSDFIAIVWDAELECMRHVEYASTRGWTYHNSATIDATPEVVALAEIHLAGILARRAIAVATREASAPRKGSIVKSTTVRGKNVGITGMVMWHGVDAYKSTRYHTAYKVGLKIEGEQKLRYLAADSVTVADPEPVDIAAITEHAKIHAQQHGWRTSF